MGRQTNEDAELALAIAMSEAEAVQPQASARLKTGRSTTDDDAQLAQCLQEEEVAAARQDGAEPAGLPCGYATFVETALLCSGWRLILEAQQAKRAAYCESGCWAWWA